MIFTILSFSGLFLAAALDPSDHRLGSGGLFALGDS